MHFSHLTKFIAAIFLISYSVYTQAHGIWFAERSQHLAFIYGEGADDLNTLKRQHKIQSVKGYDANWHAVESSLQPSGPLLLINNNDSISAASAVLNNGIWSNKQDGSWVALGRDKVPNAKLSERTMKYAVHLKGLLRVIPILKEQQLQIVPVSEGNKSFPETLGSFVTFKVLFKGTPVKGADIIVDFVNDPDATPIVSNNKGLVTIPLRNQGLNVIAAIYDSASDLPKVIDKVEHLATLSFVLPHAEE